jgi:cytochrome oxidase Cu insertion factor (SCO1/SenC/PrrC family)
MTIGRWARAVLAAAFLATAAWHQAAQAQPLKAGDKAPAFAVPASTGKEIRLADFAGKKTVILFFYIGAFTNA